MERSQAAKSAKSVFFEDFNDIDIYIEDTAPGYEKIFEEIFSRVFSGTYRVSKIFPLGSSVTVKREHKNAQHKFARPTLYVIDGDLNLINGVSLLESGLYTLPHYCIENLLLDKESLYQILNEEDPLTLRDNLIESFGYDSWEAENIPPLTDLFIDYGVCFKLHPEHQTVAYEIRNLVSSNTGNLDIEKVRARKQQIISAIQKRTSAVEYKKTREAIEGRIKAESKTLSRYVSGKDYLMPLILMRLRNTTKTKTPNTNIKVRLAMKCSIESIMDCVNYVGLPT